MSQFKVLRDKVLTDAKFRMQLVQDPAGALQSIHIEPTPQILAAVKEAVAAAEKLGHDLNREVADGPECIT